MSKSPQNLPPTTARQQEESDALWRLYEEQLANDAVLADDEMVTAEPFEMPYISGGPPPPHVMLTRLIDEAIWADRRADEAEAVRKRMADRRDRYRARADRKRTMIKQLMDLLSVTAWEGGDGTAAMRKGVAAVVITDIDKLPEQFVKVEKTAKRAEMAPLLKAGYLIEGAQMSNPEPGLRIIPY